MTGATVVPADGVECRAWRDLSRDEFFEIARLRCEVFFVEQRVDVQDFDEGDTHPDSLHYWIADEQGCAAYLRFIRFPRPEEGADFGFGRMAVRRDRRGEGLARRLMERVLADRGHLALTIHAQDYVVDMYRAFGFEVVGDLYLEAGLPHRMMHRRPTTSG